MGDRGQWKSLEELAGSRSFEEFIRSEYPSQAHKLSDPPQRRELLKLMGASLALAGMGSSCTRQPKELILPYAKYPESTVPGKPLYYATSMPWPRGAIGLLVESHEGRPTKVEGNPDHPASLGATDAFAQASVLGLYDPDRSQVITYRGRIRTWDDFLTALRKAMEGQGLKQGGGLRILTESVTSPTLAEQIDQIGAKYPKSVWHTWEPVNRDNAREGAILALGRNVACQYRFVEADVILSLDADFLGGGPESVRAARDFASRRMIRSGRESMNRLYMVETTPSLTGAMADHRLALSHGRIGELARALEAETSENSQFERDPVLQRWYRAVAADLHRHRGSSLVIPGEFQPPEVHLAAHYLNRQLGNVGRTVVYTDPVESPSIFQDWSLHELVDAMRRGDVEVLVILGGNPVLTAPADLDFGGALGEVPLRIHLASYEDETADLCDWHVNEAHFLESWSDARAADGTIGLVQPLIAPLYGGKSSHEILAALAGEAALSSHEILKRHWEVQRPGRSFDAWWRRALHDGVAAGPEAARPELRGRGNAEVQGAASSGLELVFRPDPTIWDGRFANNGWLQELPKPITRLTWDNTAQVSPATAAKLGVENEDVVELELDGRRVRAPIWIVPGQADETVVVHLGYGRRKGGKIAEGAGFDAYQLRTTKAMWWASGLKVTKTGKKKKLSSTQEHDRMEGRDLVRVATIDRFREDPHLFEEHASEGKHEPALLHSFVNTGDHAWGMVIDLNACTACSACVTACQAENNIPIVGREEVRRGRELHWIRVDRYFEGDPSKPAVHHQPVPCMHCENAPCETVCPVGATTHSSEGLNEMAYNRCIGTRYCANNCPFKVRRFNFFLYADFETEVAKLQRNPDVSVRSRGVMEKCTYCVQRINEAHIRAEKEDRPLRDGEIKTACQQVCPAEAIVFGDISDPSSAVAKLKAQPHEYGLLDHLNVRPRTTYLAKLRNPNPALEG